MLQQLFRPVLAILAVVTTAGSAPVAILNGINGSEGVLEFSYSYEGNSQVKAAVSDFRCSTDGQQTWQNMDVTALTDNELMLPGQGSFGWNSEELTGNGKAENVYMQFRLQTEAVASGWQQSVPMAQKRYDFDAAVLDGKLYVVGGGANNSTPLASVEVYDPVAGTWSTIASMGTRRKGLAAAAVDGKVYALGGWDGTYYSTMEVYDPATGAWSYTASASGPKVECELEAGNGKLYVFGGWDKSANASLDLVEEYDPDTDTWTAKTSMPISRMNMSVAFIDGKFYLMGGLHRPGDTFVSQVDVYDPAADSWSTMPNPMPTPAMDAAYGVMDGKAYLAGGNTALGQPYFGIVQIYDPATDSWAVTASQLTARSDCSGGAIDGKFYVVGGLTQPNHLYTTTSMEVYSAGTAPVYSNYVTGGPLTIDNRSIFIVAASAGTGGDISPEGDIEVMKGEDRTFSITADAGYEIADVVVDGLSMGPVGSYIFEDVRESHTIAATFVLKTYVITTSADANGVIDPAGEITVNHGDDLAITMSAELGYEIADVLVDGESVGAVEYYQMVSIDAPHIVELKIRMLYHPDIAGYVLLSTGDLEIGSIAFVVSGNAGVVNAGSELSIGNKAGVYGAEIKGDVVYVHKNASVSSEVYCNTLNGSFDGTVYSPLALPLYSGPELPEFEAASPGQDNVTINGNNDGIILSPGRYGDLEITNGRTLTLEAGDYHFSAVELKNGGVLNVLGHTRIMVAGDVDLKNGSVLNGAGVPAGNVILYAGGADVTVRGEVNATVYAAQGLVTVKPDVRFTGAVIADGIDIQPGAVITGESYFARQDHETAGKQSVFPVIKGSSEYIKLSLSPNPVVSRLSIGYTVTGSSPVYAGVYDLQGNIVRKLVDARQEAGQRRIFWDCRDTAGKLVEPGTYICRVVVGGAVSTARMIVRK